MAFWNRNNSDPSPNVARQDMIHEVEEAIAAQNLHYTYNNNGFTLHTPQGDQQFDWQQPNGLEKTLRWLTGK